MSPTRSNRLTNYKNDYTAYADVTEMVKEGGAGTYWAGDLPISTGYDTYGGWALVLVYADDTKPRNDLNVFFGHRYADKNMAIAIQLTGLVTPPAGTVHGKLGMVTWEGDYSGKGDYMTLGKVPDANNPRVYDGLNDQDNIANSAVTCNGEVIANRIPAYTNTFGTDAKIINIDGKIENEQDKVGLYLTSVGDVYYPTIVTTEVELYAPNVQVEKSVKNITRPGAQVAMGGDILEYTIDMKNIGYDRATLTTATDRLPDGVEYISGSASCFSGNNWSPRTDVSGDDEVVYDENNRSLIFYVGDNATSSEGGTLDYNQASRYRYRAVVNEPDQVKKITNTIRVDYAGSDKDKSNGGSSSASSTVTVEPQNPALLFSKVADKNTVVAEDVITYTFTVKNTGNVTLSNLTLLVPLFTQKEDYAE
ncbi:MAG: hypothetical protein SOR61_05350 [Evtepia sp.]|uniref:DUF7507 domain-containing protein n=1 Tax=Evtepia sp. TaxID=2773933 RepID=UPI002A7505EA|nr:hypothetical protein [Evtepia sp.]MDY3014605.1 hypothetical protein [Evtepia sp.]